MTIQLDKINFESDMFSTILPDNNNLVLNKVDESLKIDNTDEVEIKCINIEIVTADGEYLKCSNIIGLENEFFKIATKYKQYEGAVLTPDNMEYCTLEIYES